MSVVAAREVGGVPSGRWHEWWRPGRSLTSVVAAWAVGSVSGGGPGRRQR
jgi:hypothetical protein